MTFQEQLTAYIRAVKSTNKELAEAAHVSTGTVGRWRTGKNLPGRDSVLLARVVDGLASLSAARETGLSREQIESGLLATLEETPAVPYETWLARLNTLLQKLEINGTELARGLNYDPSYIYRILGGARHPADVELFTEKAAAFLAERFDRGDERETVSAALNLPAETLTQPGALYGALMAWLGSEQEPQPGNPVRQFLETMDAFDPDEYIRVLRFDDIRLTEAPFRLPEARTYTGLAGIRESELDFIRATVASPSTEDCILYSDMPMEEMARDMAFSKKWMLGRAMMLRKGLRLILIHNLNRPLREMMLGLESGIPLYMTGQIAPYYLPGTQNEVFTHFLNVSGAAALVGEGIAGHHDQARYTLTVSDGDVRYYREKAAFLLQKAKPLMRIYRADAAEAFRKELSRMWQGDARMVCGSLPLFTIGEAALTAVLRRAGCGREEIGRAQAYRQESLTRAQRLLAHHRLLLEIPRQDPGSFERQPLRLWLSEIFSDRDVFYTYAEYEAHLAATLAFAAQSEGCSVRMNPAPSFRNITFTIIGQRCVIVSKDKSPTVHFIIHHPRVVQAFRQFIPPVTEPAGNEGEPQK